MVGICGRQGPNAQMREVLIYRADNADHLASPAPCDPT